MKKGVALSEKKVGKTETGAENKWGGRTGAKASAEVDYKFHLRRREGEEDTRLKPTPNTTPRDSNTEQYGIDSARSEQERHGLIRLELLIKAELKVLRLSRRPVG